MWNTNYINDEQSTPNQRKPYVQIIEQPASQSIRFRYKCEGRFTGPIPGVSSTFKYKTFPTIQVVGYRGKAKVVISCVTNESPYRPHPHNVICREGSKYGVSTLDIPEETMTLQLHNVGVQCVKKRDVIAELNVREERKIDPFKTGFSHKNEINSLDLNSVRLCFQVFLKDKNTGRYEIPLRPIVSDPIYDKKSVNELVIVKLSDVVAYVDPKKEIILLCEKVSKGDIQVRFFEEQQGVVVWEGFAYFQPSQVHKQSAISFKPPRYYDLDVQDPVDVFIQLRRPSDGATSEPIRFLYLPIEERKRKKPKLEHMRNFDQAMGLACNFEAAQTLQEPRVDTATPIWNIPLEMKQTFNQFLCDYSANHQNIPYLEELPENFFLPIGTNVHPNNPENLVPTELKPIDIRSGDLCVPEEDCEIRNLSETFCSNLFL